MFGSSSPFGQSSSTPFGSQSPFGQNNATNNPFAPKPFGAVNPFGSQTGGSIFGSTSTGVFGQSSSSMSSTPAFGASSSGFGSSTPAFGSQSSPFGGSSAFGGFGSGTQTSPFGSSFQQSQPAISSNLFGSTAQFGAPSQPSFGSASTSAFGSSTTPAFGSPSSTGFGATSTSAFGSTPSPSFGSTGSAFGVGSTPTFGSTGVFGSSNTSAFGANSAPAFGATTTPAFGTTSTPPFGAASTPTFGQPSSQAFGASGSTTAFGASNTPSFSFNSSPAFGQSTSPFGSPGFGTIPTPFGGQSSSGLQATTPTFGTGQSNMGGSRVAPYQATADTDGPSNQPQGKLESISAMQAYKDKSHEELRWEDYQRGDKGGGANAGGQSTSGLSFGVPGGTPNPFGTPTIGQSAANPFSVSTPSTQTNIFAPKPFGVTGPGTSTPTFTSSPFGSTPATAPSLFGSTPAQTASPFGSTPAFTSSSIFGAASSSATGTSSIFGATPSQGPSQFSTSAFGSQPSTLFQSPSPSHGVGQNNSLFGPNPTFPNFNTTSSFSTGGFGNTSFATGGLLGFGQSTPSLASPFQPSLPSQSNNLFSFNNTGQTQAGGASSTSGQSFAQFGSGNQNSAVLQPVAITNPFGTLPAMPHISIGNSGTSPSIHYGISSMPVVDKPNPVRVPSLLTTRHLSQRRIRLPARKYNPKNDCSRVAFFSEEEESPSTPKADALFIPRENPRSLIIRPIEHWPKSSIKEASVLVYENGNATVESQHHQNGSTAGGNNGIVNGNGSMKEQNRSVRFSQKSPTNNDDTPNQKGDSYITLSGHRDGEAAIVYEHGADIEALMPKLRHSDYYTEPRIQELAAKERAEPGYFKHVKDFIVGRHNYGSIKFLGETDVRRLDLESLIQFNDREMIVYMDDSKKPPIGQGLNKPAKVTLLNIKGYEKNKKQITIGPKIEKYMEMLKKKAEDLGAEFVSYDAIKGEWKFRVDHFSKYVFSDDDDQWGTD